MVVFLLFMALEIWVSVAGTVMNIDAVTYKEMPKDDQTTMSNQQMNDLVHPRVK